jgi:hypothetical protein
MVNTDNTIVLTVACSSSWPWPPSTGSSGRPLQLSVQSNVKRETGSVLVFWMKRQNSLSRSLQPKRNSQTVFAFARIDCATNPWPIRILVNHHLARKRPSHYLPSSIREPRNIPCWSKQGENPTAQPQDQTRLPGSFQQARRPCRRCRCRSLLRRRLSWRMKRTS